MQQRESARKAAASAVAVAAERSSSAPHGVGSSDSSSREQHGKVGNRIVNQEENAVARTASWLNRAKSALKDPAKTKRTSTPKAKPRKADDLRSQMQEVERLINEGPAIQQTSAELPEMIDKAEEEAHPSASEDNMSAGSSDIEPADKRLRTAEDAEALVGFLRSVRASAAAGREF